MIEKKRRHPLDARLLKKKIEGKGISILRVLEVREDKTILVIDCISAFMPKWITVSELEDYEPCELEDLLEQTKMVLPEINTLNAEAIKLMHQRYNMIASILPFISDEKMRSALIERASCYCHLPLSKNRRKLLSYNYRNCCRLSFLLSQSASFL